MTDIKAIANRTSIMLKIDMDFLHTSSIVCQQGNISYEGVMHLAGWYYVIPDGSNLEGIVEFGIHYYTTDSSEVTEIPFNDVLFKKNDSKAHYSGEACIFPIGCSNMESDSHTVYLKVRDTPNHPLMCLVKGLVENTEYHIGYYYKDGNDTKTAGPYHTVQTKPVSDTNIVFNTPVIADNIPSNYASNAATLSTNLVEELSTVANIFKDTTNVNQTYSPTIVYSDSNFAANSYMEFNCSKIDPNLRSTIIHELQHNHFDSKGTISGEFATSENVIKFMEFATDCEDATWGRISGHYYPIISSESYDYIDDYLVCMATDVDYLFGTT